MILSSRMRQDHLAWGLEKQSAKIRRPDEGGVVDLVGRSAATRATPQGPEFRPKIGSRRKGTLGDLAPIGMASPLSSRARRVLAKIVCRFEGRLGDLLGNMAPMHFVACAVAPGTKIG